MLGEDPRENWLSEWFRGLTMGARIQIVMFSAVAVALGAAGAIALIEEPAVLLPDELPDSKALPGEPERPASPNPRRTWQKAEKVKKPEAPSNKSSTEIETIRKMLVVSPEEPEIWDQLGQSLYRVGQYDEAVKAFRKALEIKPGVAEVIASLGVVLKTKGEMTEYEKMVQSLAAVNPQMARELMDFSPKKNSSTESPSTPVASVPPSTDTRPPAALKESGEVAALRKMVEIDPRDSVSWNQLGKALYKSGKYAEAVEALDRSLAIKPDVEEVVVNLGVTLKTKGDAVRYASVLEKLSAINPKVAKDLEAFQPSPATKR
jgi:cytochrome c-type biogenesis protein CcmH/NrfG